MLTQKEVEPRVLIFRDSNGFGLAFYDQDNVLRRRLSGAEKQVAVADALLKENLAEVVTNRLQPGWKQPEESELLEDSWFEVFKLLL